LAESFELNIFLILNLGPALINIFTAVIISVTWITIVIHFHPGLLFAVKAEAVFLVMSDPSMNEL
jgi:hypothetical protein